MMKNFWIAWTLILIFFAPASCEKSGHNIAQALVKFLESR